MGVSDERFQKMFHRDPSRVLSTQEGSSTKTSKQPRLQCTMLQANHSECSYIRSSAYIFAFIPPPNIYLDMIIYDNLYIIYDNL